MNKTMSNAIPVAAIAMALAVVHATLWGAEPQPRRETRNMSWFIQRMQSLDHLPEYLPGKTEMTSTYCRKGANTTDADDWKGLDGDRNVLLDVDGPGCVVRIANAAGKGSGKGGADGTNIRVFIDRSPEPVMDMQVHQFNQTVLPGTRGGASTGYSVTFFPIPFAKHCRIELYNPGKTNWGWFWEVAYTLYPKDTLVESLTWPLADADSGLLNEVARVWNEARSAPPPAPNRWTVERQIILAPNASERIAIPGQGVIRQLRVLADPATKAVLSGIRMRLFWDGDMEPSVDMPLGYFFGHIATGHKDCYYSLPLGVAAEYAYCRFPMPFRDGAAIAFDNSTNEKVTLKVEVDVKTPAADFGGLGRFQATLTETEVAAEFANRQALPSKGPLKVPCHTVLDLKGCRGKYVGMFMHVDWNADFWWGEGDPLIWTDDEVEGWPPPYHGTGTETYFNSGWCRFGNIAVSGIIRPPKMRPGHIGVYSYHLNDVFPFERKLHFLMEIWPWNFDPAKEGAFKKIPQASWRSTAYWYKFSEGR